MFFGIQLVCPNGSKMLPKSTHKPPSWSQNGHLGGHVGLSWRSWPPSWPQVAPTWAPRGLKMELGRWFFRRFLGALCGCRGRPPQNSENHPKMVRKCSKNDSRNVRKRIEKASKSTLKNVCMYVCMYVCRYVGV